MNSKNIFLEALEANPFFFKINNNNNNNNLGANFAIFKTTEFRKTIMGRVKRSHDLFSK